MINPPNHSHQLPQRLSAQQRTLLNSYLLNLRRGPDAVKTMIVSDMRRMLDLGARDQARERLAVLRLFKSALSDAAARGQAQ